VLGFLIVEIECLILFAPLVYFHIRYPNLDAVTNIRCEAQLSSFHFLQGFSHTFPIVTCFHIRPNYVNEAITRM